ncbi:MAG: molybdopterin-binding protein, partial [Candidatus Bathyarchaeia archaeon]
RFTQLGIKVKRITVVDDELSEIAQAFTELASRNPDVVISTGGLGPTFDDKTLLGLAKAFRLELQIHHTEAKKLQEKYLDMWRRGTVKNPALTSERLKMVTLPQTADVISNPVGAAPAVRFKRSNTIFYLLPGVPSEMEAIFSASIDREVVQLAPDASYAEDSLEVFGVPESELAPLISAIMQKYPRVYIKSHPGVHEGKSRVELHFSVYSSFSERPDTQIISAVAEICETLIAMGGKIRRTAV